MQFSHSDTDSLLFRVQTKDLYRDMGEFADQLDTSNYDRSHPLYSNANKAVPGKFKVDVDNITVSQTKSS